MARGSKVHSVSPEAMTAHLDLYRRLMFGRSELSRREREAIAVAVSATNACHYWMHHHGEALRRAGGDPDEVAAFVRGDSGALPDARSRRLLAFALKLTRTPQAIEAGDLHALRDAGLSDAGVHDVAAVTAYFNFVNRIALGLGVELEAAGGEDQGRRKR